MPETGLVVFKPLPQEELKAEMKRVLLETYSAVGTIREACEVTGIPNRTAYRWRVDDPRFAADWDRITHTCVAPMLEQTAIERAKEKSDLLMMFLLKAYDRKKYDDKQALLDKPEQDNEIRLILDEVTFANSPPSTPETSGPTKK